MASNPVGMATVLPPVASCTKWKAIACPAVQAARVDAVMLAVRAVLRVNRVVVPAEDDPQVNVGVAENVVVTLDAAFPVPPLLVPHAPPASTVLPFASNLTQSFVVVVPVLNWNLVPFPCAEVTAAGGNPVTLVITPEEGVPRAGVINVGLVPNTANPLPVSSVIAAARLAEDGVARKVAAPVPRPDTPVLIGSPVALVKTPEAGVPKSGVTRVGDVLRTTLPLPVLPVTPVPPFATGRVPVTPVAKGRPVTFASTPDAGVPSAGAVNTGDVIVLLVRV